MGFFRSLVETVTSPFRRRKKKPKPKYVPTPEEALEPGALEAPESEDVIGSESDQPDQGYRIVDYMDAGGTWRNTDPAGQVTTDGSRMGQGDGPPTTEDVEASPWINVGFQDDDGEWYYKWIQGPFDSEFWIDDAIEQIVGEYGIAYGSAN